MNNIFIVIDIESSGLSTGSYPIEIAWLDEEGNKDSFLITPSKNWLYWDDYAEDYIHKISRDELFQKGITHLQAANRLNKALSGKTVYSDVVHWDKFWLKQLYSEAQVSMDSRCEDIYSKLPIDDDENYERILEETKQMQRPHRALADCINIMKVWKNTP